MHRNTRAADADGVGTAVYWGNDSLSGKQLSELLGRPAGGGRGPLSAARTPTEAWGAGIADSMATLPPAFREGP